MREGSNPSRRTRSAIASTSVVVLPVPGPASTSSGPPRCSTTFRCAGSRSGAPAGAADRRTSRYVGRIRPPHVSAAVEAAALESVGVETAAPEPAGREPVASGTIGSGPFGSGPFGCEPPVSGPTGLEAAAPEAASTTPPRREGGPPEPDTARIPPDATDKVWDLSPLKCDVVGLEKAYCDVY